MDTKDTILEILEDMHPEVDFLTEKKLVSGHILDSFDLVSLVTELTSEFDIEIGAKDFIEENFNSLEAMVDMVEHLKEM